MEVHKILGKGFCECTCVSLLLCAGIPLGNEIVYKDAIEYEFDLKDIPYEREKEFDIIYKGIILPRKYNADFVVYDKIILEVKAIESITNSHIRQTLNYLAADVTQGRIIRFESTKS